jgi:hypothetical protein
MIKLFILVLAVLAVASAQFIATSPYVTGASYSSGIVRAGGYVAAPTVYSAGYGYRGLRTAGLYY